MVFYFHEHNFCEFKFSSFSKARITLVTFEWHIIFIEKYNVCFLIVILSKVYDSNFTFNWSFTFMKRILMSFEFSSKARITWVKFEWLFTSMYMFNVSFQIFIFSKAGMRSFTSKGISPTWTESTWLFNLQIS